MKDFQISAEYIAEKMNGFKPKYAIVLGSGLADVGEEIEQPIFISYDDIPAFPRSTVEGHTGQLIAGFLAGQPVICMQCRFHYYEGHKFDKIAVPIRAFKELGCESLILTNAAGSLNAEMPPGSIMLIEDHINFSGCNPLIGVNDSEIGPRFVDLTEAYCPDLNRSFEYAADQMDMNLFKGNYIWVSGPTFETPAEIRAYSILGADAVGMSTVPEVIIANHCGLPVCALSTITNLAAGMAGFSLSHDETLEQGKLAAANLTALIKQVLNEQ